MTDVADGGAVQQGVGPFRLRLPATATILAVVVVVGLAGFDPVGWDHFGPIRWMLLPALGFWAVAGRSDRIGPPAGQRRPVVVTWWLWAGFLVWGLVAAALAVDPLHAWLGTPDRRFGWFTWLLCGGLFLVAKSSSERERMVVVRAFAVGASLIGLLTAAEWLGLWFDIDFASGRLGGPFGQPAYLGAATALATPISAGLVGDRDQPQRWRLTGGAGLAGGGFALLASQSRAAWLGLAVALVIAAVVGARTPERTRASSLRPIAAALGVLAAVVVAVPALRSRVSAGFDDRGVISGRIDEWRVGWRALSDSPIIGYGPEGYRTVFGRHVDEDYVIKWGRDVITDRAHGGVLDVGLSFGLLGTALHLGLLLLVGVAAVRSIGRGGPLRLGLAVGTLAYGIQQQFLFPLSELDPLFWIGAGLLLVDEIVPGSGRSSPSAPVVRGLAIGLALLSGAAGLLDLAANAGLASAVAQDDTDRALDRVDLAVGLRPDSIRYRFIGARLAAGADRPDADRDALDRIDRALQRSPTDPALRAERSRLLLDVARATTTEPERTRALTVAGAELELLVADDPNHPVHLQRLAIALALQGRFDRAIELLDRAVALAPESSEAEANRDEVERLRSQNLQVEDNSDEN